MSHERLLATVLMKSPFWRVRPHCFDTLRRSGARNFGAREKQRNILRRLKFDAQIERTSRVLCR